MIKSFLKTEMLDYFILSEYKEAQQLSIIQDSQDMYSNLLHILPKHLNNSKLINKPFLIQEKCFHQDAVHSLSGNFGWSLKTISYIDNSDLYRNISPSLSSLNLSIHQIIQLLIYVSLADKEIDRTASNTQYCQDLTSGTF